MKIHEVFVNREKELSKMEAFYAHVSEGKPILLMVSGRIGSGKSTLIDKFLENKRGFYFECFLGQPPYAPLSNFLKSFQAIEKKEIDPRLGFLLAEKNTHAMEGQTYAEEFGLLLNFFSTYITNEPIIFVIDNFHDCDEGTVKFLDYFIKNAGTLKIMIICAYRTEVLEETGRGSFLTEFLKNLIMNDMFNALIVDNFDEVTTRILLTKLFGDKVPEKCVKPLQEKSGGNPLILTEILKILSEDRNLDLTKTENWESIDWEKLSIPDNLQELFQMELDALPPDALLLLDYMVVSGVEFEADIVSEACGQPLEKVQSTISMLVEKGIVMQDSVTGKYKFTKNIYVELIYNDIGAKILPICFAIGTAIEKLRKDRINEYVFDLVRLFGNSRDRRRAYEYAMRAAKKAEQLHAPESVIKYYELAVKLAEELDMGWEDIYEIKMMEGTSLFYIGAWDKSEACFVEIMDMAKQHEDKKRETECLLLLIKLRQYQSEYQKARALLQKAVELAKTTADSRFIADALRAIAHIEWRTGEYQNAIKHYNEALSYFQSASAEAIFTGNVSAPEETVPIKGEILLELGNVYTEMGEYKQALLLNLKGMKILKETNSPVTARALYSIGVIHGREENWAKAIESFKHGIETAEKINDLDTLGWCYLGIAEAMLSSNQNAEEAKNNIEKAKQYLSKINDRIGNAILHKNHATICMKLNDLAGAEEHIKSAESLAQMIASPYINAEILTAKIELALLRSDKDTAKELLSKLEDMCKKYGIKSFIKFIEGKKMLLTPPQPVEEKKLPAEEKPSMPVTETVQPAVSTVAQQSVGEGAEGTTKIAAGVPNAEKTEDLKRKKRKKKKGGDMQ